MNDSEAVMKRIFFAVCDYYDYQRETSDRHQILTRKYRNLRILYVCAHKHENEDGTRATFKEFIDDANINSSIVESLRIINCKFLNHSELEIALGPFTNLIELVLEKNEQKNEMQHKSEIAMLSKIVFKHLEKFTFIQYEGLNVGLKVDLSTFFEKSSSTLLEVCLKGKFSRETYQVLLKMKKIKSLTIISNQGTKNDESDPSTAEVNNSVETLAFSANARIFPFLKKFTNVKMLNILKSDDPKSFNHECWKYLGENMTQLEKIIFNYDIFHHDEKGLSGLKFHSVKNVRFVEKFRSSCNFLKILDSFPNLEKLDVDEYNSWGEDIISTLIEEKLLTKLKYLKIDDGLRIDTDKVILLFKRKINLRTIIIPKESIYMNIHQSIKKSLEDIKTIQGMITSTQYDSFIRLDNNLLPKNIEMDDQNENEEIFMELDSFPDEIFLQICDQLSSADLINLKNSSKRFVILVIQFIII